VVFGGAGDVRALVFGIGHAVVVVIEFGAAVFVFKAIEVFGFVGAFVDVVVVAVAVAVGNVFDVRGIVAKAQTERDVDAAFVQVVGFERAAVHAGQGQVIGFDVGGVPLVESAAYVAGHP